MKTKKYLLLFALITLIFVGGCGKTEEQSKKQNSESMFVEVESEWGCYSVIYHKKTKVMYTVSNGTYNTGTFTLLVDSDGTPMIWEE